MAVRAATAPKGTPHDTRARAVVAGLREPDPDDETEAAVTADQNTRRADAGWRETADAYGLPAEPQRPWSTR